ncbi:MAG: hypothetical protein NC033_06075 [Clostridiales bacterium]|nr:hypothetical protein [Clostridiales bacterium]
MSSEKFKLSPKAKKIINIVVNVVCGIVLVIALFLAINMIISKRKGYGNYTEIFGKAYLAVESNSMSKNIDTDEVGYGNFSKGDLVTIKILDSGEKNSLKVGDIITYRTKEIVQGQWRLNTHRIVAIEEVDGVRRYTTRGDANSGNDSGTRTNDDILGEFIGSKKGGGKVISFMGTSTGFFVFVVLPTLIIVVIAAANFVMVVIRERKAQKVAADQAQLDERERIRQELLAEMQAGSAGGDNTQTDASQPQEQAEQYEEEVTAEENSSSEDKTDEEGE